MRTLSPNDYGLAAMGASIVLLVNLFSEFGFGTAIVQAQNVSRKQCASMVSASLLLGIFSYALIFAVSPYLSEFFREPRIRDILRISAIGSILVGLSTVPDALLRRGMNFKLLSYIDLTATVVGSLLTVTLALSGAEFWSLVWGQLGTITARLSLLLVLVQPRTGITKHITPAYSLIRFGGQLSLARFAAYPASQADILIGSRMLGKESLGYYSVALDLALMPLNKIMSLVNQLALPVLATKVKLGTDAMRHEFLLGLKFSMLVITPCLWGLTAIAPWLVPIVLGERWAPIVPVLQIITLSLPFRIISNFNTTASVSFGRPEIAIRDTLTSVAVLPLGFLVGAQFGLVGLASAWLFSLPIITIISMRRFLRFFHVPSIAQFEAVAPALLISGIMSLVTYSMGHLISAFISGPTLVVTLIVIGATCYLSLLWMVDPSSARLLLHLLTRR